MKERQEKMSQPSVFQEPGKAIVSVLLMAGMFTFGAMGSYKAIRSKTWPTTPGRIVASAEVSKSAGKGFSHGVEADYVYTIAGREYRAKFFKETAARGTSEWAEAIRRYQADSKLTVYFDPENPKDSVIEPGLTFFNILLTGVPLIILVVIASVTVKEIRKNVKTQ